MNTGTNNFSLKNAGGFTGRDTPYVPVNQSSASKPDTVSPYRVSEWYSYDHSASTLCSQFTVSSQNIVTNYIYYKITLTGCAGQSSSISINLQNETNNSYDYIVNVYEVYPFNNAGVLTSSTPFTTATLKYIDLPSINFPYTLPSSTADLYIVCWNNSIL